MRAAMTSKVRKKAGRAVREIVARASGRSAFLTAQRRAAAAERRNAALEARCALLVEQRDRARNNKDLAVAARDARRRLAAAEQRTGILLDRTAVLREQRDRGRYAIHALNSLARGLELDIDPTDGVKPLRRTLGQVRAEALLADGLLHGQSLDEAAVRSVRALLTNPQSVARARALITALQSDPRTHAAGSVAAGHYLLVWGSRQAAHEQFSNAPVDLLVRTAAVESLTCALRVDHAAGELLAAQLIDHPDLGSADAYHVAGVLAGHHMLEPAGRALERAREAGEMEEDIEKGVARLQLWLDTHPADLDTVAPPRTRPTIGVLHYEQPHWARSSANIGDYTQTVAVLGHLLRRRGLRLHADDAELQGALNTLRADISPDLLLETSAAEVDIVPVSRDASRWEALPDPTWTIAFGWYMHPVFGVRNDLPFHSSVRPIFISFHVNRPEILTPEALEYLRRHGPVGCRDWSTVDLLLSHGVDAFFSGCVTTTTHITGGTRDASAQETGDPTVGRVDVRGLGSGSDLSQATNDVRDRSFGANLLAARDRHRVLRDDFASLHTSRLHVYLPATAMGVEVEFEPRNAADVRFEGLAGMTPGSPELREMQERISGLLDMVLDLVERGTDEATVYRAWRERTQPLVEKARARRAGWQAFRPPVESLAGAAAPVNAEAVHLGEGGDVHVAIALDHNLVDVAPVVLQGIDDGTTRDVRVHVLTRGVPTETIEDWAATFPRLRFSHYRFDDVEYGSITRLLAHTTVSTMDRLLLPDVLADLPRVVYIDIDVAVLGDVGELWDLDLGGAPLAARPTVSEWAESGLAFVYRVANRLPVELAREFRSYMHARVDGDFTSFNAGILVFDLDRMRDDRFSEVFAGMAGRYGLNDQDVLCCYTGNDAALLDARWNTFPTREAIPEGVRLVHYAGGLKPWKAMKLPGQELWLAAQDRYLRRLSETPGVNGGVCAEASSDGVLAPPLSAVTAGAR